MGSSEQPDYIAHNIEFRSNILKGMKFDIDATEQPHNYIVYWTLKINAHDKTGRPSKDAAIIVTDKNGKEVLRQKTGSEGLLSIELPEYSVDGSVKTFFSPFTVSAGKKKSVVDLKNNSEIDLLIK